MPASALKKTPAQTAHVPDRPSLERPDPVLFDVTKGVQKVPALALTGKPGLIKPEQIRQGQIIFARPSRARVFSN